MGRGLEEKAEELRAKASGRGGPAGGIYGEVQQLSFLRQGHMGLVIPLVTCGVEMEREKDRAGKEGLWHRDKWGLAIRAMGPQQRGT